MGKRIATYGWILVGLAAALLAGGCVNASVGNM